MLVTEFNQSSNDLIGSISLASTILLTASEVELFDSRQNGQKVWATSQFDLGFEGIVVLLDKGIDVVFIEFGALEKLSMATIEEGLREIPSSRLGLIFKPDSERPQYGPNINAFAQVVDYFIIVDPPAAETIVSLSASYPNNIFLIKSKDDPVQLLEKGFNVVLNADNMSLEHEKGKINFVELLLVHAKSDRADKLFPTVVVDEQGVALGLCYSSPESISESLKTKSGVYLSRTRGLWYKGKTSGATQKLLKVDLDCDSDTLRFTVNQKGPGFCHLDTRTCFGADNGISALYSMLNSRMETAPPKSYTKRLFNDRDLLHSKIREEADELCTATEKDEIAWEAADLIYFAFVKAVASGVSLSDIERHLDQRSKKITRRAGNAKPVHAVQPIAPISTPIISAVPLKPFQMHTYSLSKLSKSEKAKLLLRPIINTNEIMDRVRPIVQQVRAGGDAAIKELTSRFDKVDLESVVLKAPFAPSLMEIPAHVKSAIDLAYSNIEKFHLAQMETESLVVETMPGVTCTRFARPIERVGLYVPGGTAVLPSSTLMLGIPAKVAGCHEIVFATPPRKDGSIVPEVVYVAHKVGASMIVKAGGAQAVAAMAYGTESVPKVDKICGPGNQYVTAAKMIAQVCLRIYL